MSKSPEPKLVLSSALGRLLPAFLCLACFVLPTVLLLNGSPSTAQSQASPDSPVSEPQPKRALIDKTGKVKYPLPYQSVMSFCEGLATVERGGRFGFVNQTGQLSIPIKFVSAGDFACGLASVSKSDNSAVGYIDRGGREVISPRFDVSNQFYNNYLNTSIGASSVLVDKHGDIMKKATAQEEKQIDFSRGADTVVFAEKLVQVKQKHYRVLALPAGMQPLSRFSEGLCSVQYGPDMQWYDFVDGTGSLVTHGHFLGVNDFRGGLAVVFTPSKKYGYVDRAGQFVIPPVYDEAHDFSEGLAAVRVGRRSFFIDKQGRTVLKPGYYQAGEFSEGLAPVGKYGKFGYIDKTGKLVVDYQFKEAGPFQNGVALVSY